MCELLREECLDDVEVDRRERALDELIVLGSRFRRATEGVVDVPVEQRRQPQHLPTGALDRSRRQFGGPRFVNVEAEFRRLVATVEEVDQLGCRDRTVGPDETDQGAGDTVGLCRGEAGEPMGRQLVGNGGSERRGARGGGRVAA